MSITRPGPGSEAETEAQTGPDNGTGEATVSPAMLLAALCARRIALVPTADAWNLHGPRAALAQLTELETAPLREALTWRRMAMAAQVPATGAIPMLRAKAGPFPAGCCWSCGEEPLAVANPADRCPLCTEAARAALAQVRPPRGAARMR